MILTVTPNPALDLTWHVTRLVPGATHRVPEGTARAGGKGLNVARVLHSLCHDVVALTAVGGATGDQFRVDLEESGVPHRLIPTASPTRRSAAIVDEATGETAILNEAGAPLTLAEATALAETAETVAVSAGAVAISGSLRPGFGPGELAALVGRVARSAPVVVDTSGPGLLAAARAGAHVLKPNREELEAATGLADPRAGARALRDLGAGLVVLSLGEEGLALFPREGDPISARLPRPLRGNATGAGDAAVAAVAAALAAGDDLWSAGSSAHAARIALARRATAWSAAAVLMPLAGELSPRHEALEADVLITTITEVTA
ncbi:MULTISPECIES: PfkB family carbohydrate kinase [Microbacterium]|uniref:1-phosphofructokinase family hexose kinase n=1 Tax=Microbacterium TaxID=33882 RepID=UPI00146CA1D5|nr:MULTISPECIES: PfkB family carbohydrate kinase [Microbacterium]